MGRELPETTYLEIISALKLHFSTRVTYVAVKKREGITIGIGFGIESALSASLLLSTESDSSNSCLPASIYHFWGIKLYPWGGRKFLTSHLYERKQEKGPPFLRGDHRVHLIKRISDIWKPERRTTWENQNSSNDRLVTLSIYGKSCPSPKRILL